MNIYANYWAKTAEINNSDNNPSVLALPTTHYRLPTRRWPSPLDGAPAQLVVCVCGRTGLSYAFGPAHLSSPAKLLQLFAFDGVAQVNARPKEQRSEVDAGLSGVGFVSWNLIIELMRLGKVQLKPANSCDTAQRGQRESITHLSGTNSSQSFTSESGTFFTLKIKKYLKLWWIAASCCTFKWEQFLKTHHLNELPGQLHDGNLTAGPHIVDFSHAPFFQKQQEGVDGIVDKQEMAGFREGSLDGAAAQKQIFKNPN